MTVRVLIAIVTHNSAEVIAECVERLAGLCDAADFQVEIVVADNPSRDGTIRDPSRDSGTTTPDPV